MKTTIREVKAYLDTIDQPNAMVEYQAMVTMPDGVEAPFTLYVDFGDEVDMRQAQWEATRSAPGKTLRPVSVVSGRDLTDEELVEVAFVA